MKRQPAKLHPLLHSAELLEKRLAALLKPMGVRPRQARILHALGRMGRTSQTSLAKEFSVSAGTMSSMTERLVALDFITRIQNPKDRRGDILELAPLGSELLEDILDVWQEVDDIIETALGPEKTAQLFALTTELRIAMGGHVPGKPWIGDDSLNLETESHEPTRDDEDE